MKLAEHSIATIALRLRARREELGLSVSQLAAVLGINQGQVSRILRGGFRKLDGRAMQVCKFLAVDVSEFQCPEGARARRALENALFDLWDGSAEDADRLVRLLNFLSELRRGSRA